LVLLPQVVYDGVLSSGSLVKETLLHYALLGSSFRVMACYYAAGVWVDSDLGVGDVLSLFGNSDGASAIIMSKITDKEGLAHQAETGGRVDLVCDDFTGEERRGSSDDPGNNNLYMDDEPIQLDSNIEDENSCEIPRTFIIGFKQVNYPFTLTL